MPIGCKDIIVTINGFNLTETFTVILRAADSVANINILPTYTQIATGPQVKFSNLPEGDYEVGIQKKCEGGAVLPIVWQDASSPTCALPAGYSISGITGTGATLNWTSATIDYRVDKGTWAVGGATSQALTGLVAGRVYEAEIRRNCGSFAKSLPLLKSFATTIGSPTLDVRILKKLCDGNYFGGYLIRFSFTGGIAATGSNYQISFTDYYGDTVPVVDREVLGGEILEDIVRDIANNFNPVNFIVGSNYAAFDIISLEQKVATGVNINCQDINLSTGYGVAIV